MIVIHWYFCVAMYEDVCLYRHTYNLRTIILSIVMLERPMGLANASPQGDRSDSTLFNGLPSMMCCSSCPHSSCSLNSQEFKSPLLVCLHPRWRASDRLQQSLRHWGRGPSSPDHGFCNPQTWGHLRRHWVRDISRIKTFCALQVFVLELISFVRFFANF